MTGDEDAALEAVDHGMEKNPYVAPWLVGMGQGRDEELPVTFDHGTEAEAQLCAQILGEAWAAGSRSNRLKVNVVDSPASAG